MKETHVSKMPVEGNIWNIKESLISPEEDRKGGKIMKRDGTKRKQSNTVNKLNTTGNHINSKYIKHLKTKTTTATTWDRFQTERKCKTPTIDCLQEILFKYKNTDSLKEWK